MTPAALRIMKIEMFQIIAFILRAIARSQRNRNLVFKKSLPILARKFILEYG
jgi:hypothetical protein